MYLEKYEPDFWALYITGQKEGKDINMKPKVKYRTFPITLHLTLIFHLHIQDQIRVKPVTNY